jgi:DNA-binding protein H-NS
VDISDKLKDMREKAEETAAEHKEQIQEAVAKAGAAADEHTGGKYREQIAKAGAKVDAYVEGLRPAEGGQDEKVSEGEAPPPASGDEKPASS